MAEDGVADQVVASPTYMADIRFFFRPVDVDHMGAKGIDTLKTAFTGLMNRDPSQADSYFVLAGIHGLPQAWCLHHEDRFNPWHRVYLRDFEDALRSIPGCQDVTLPYWDLTTPLPDLLQQPPFARVAEARRQDQAKSSASETQRTTRV